MDYGSTILISRQAVKKSKFRFWWNFEFFSRYFVLFCSYFFAFITFGDFSSYFKITKQALGHNHKNTIFQQGKCSFILNVKTSSRRNASANRGQYHSVKKKTKTKNNNNNKLIEITK